MLLQLERDHVAGVEERYGTAVAEATRRVLAIRSDWLRCNAEHLANLGDELAAVKKKLPHGRWMEWLQQDAGMDKSTAAYAMEFAELRRSNFRTFGNLSGFEVSKIYRLLDAPREAIRDLTPGTALPPGTGQAPKALGVMTARELAGALRLLGRKRASSTPPVQAVALPHLDTSGKAAFAASFLSAVRELIRQAPLIRKLPGKLTPAAKEAAESAVELLRKAVLRWPAWARRHRGGGAAAAVRPRSDAFYAPGRDPRWPAGSSRASAMCPARAPSRARPPR